MIESMRKEWNSGVNIQDSREEIVLHCKTLKAKCMQRPTDSLVLPQIQLSAMLILFHIKWLSIDNLLYP